MPYPAERPFQVCRHAIGSPVEDDGLVLQEDDERFELNVEPTKSERCIVLTSWSQVTSETRYLLAGEPEAQPRLVEARRDGIEYSIDHQGDRFLILTNDGAINFRLMAAPVSSPGRDAWTEVVPERSGGRLNMTDVFAGHVVLGQRSDGLQRLEVVDCAGGALHVGEQLLNAYNAFPG